MPCFILAGDIMQTGGLASRLINVARVLVRHLTGGLGMVTVLSATFFAALSGSSPATTAAIGSIMIPEMERRGYRRDFSTALAASAGPLGQMIPPSIPMVIWGVISETSITALFFAGIVPGLLTSCGLMAVCYWVARAQGVLGDEHRASGRELVAAIADGKWALLTPLIILGGIYGGVFTPTEAGAVAVAYSLVIGVFVHREMKLSELPGILLKSMRTTAIAVFILTTALCFGFLIALEDLPARVTGLLFSISDDPVVVLLMLNLLLLIIGAFMDTISAMVILATVLIAIGAQLGLDPGASRRHHRDQPGDRLSHPSLRHKPVRGRRHLGVAGRGDRQGDLADAAGGNPGAAGGHLLSRGHPHDPAAVAVTGPVTPSRRRS